MSGVTVLRGNELISAPRIYSTTSTFHDAITNKLFLLDYLSDIRWISLLKIPIEYGLDTFLNFIIIIGETSQWNIPFGLLVKLSNVTISHDNKHHLIFLPKSLFFKDNDDVLGFPLIALSQNEIKIIVTSKDPTPYQLLVQDIFLETNTQKTYAQQGPFSYTIRQYQEIQVPDQKSLVLQSEFLSTGFFVESNEISSVKIFINDKILCDYDKDLFKHYCRIIFIEYPPQSDSGTWNWNLFGTSGKPSAKYLYWIPFNPSKLWSDSDLRCYIDLSEKYENISTKIRVEFDTSIKGKIYILGYRTLEICCGSAQSYIN